MNQEDTFILFTVLLNSLKNRGLKKTINLLNDNKDTNQIIILEDKTLKLVDAVCLEFNTSFQDVYNSKFSRGEKKYIIGFIVYYLYKNYTLSEIKNNVFTTLSRGLLSSYKQLIFDLDKNKIANEKYIKIKNNLDLKIN
jgi:hypothetical protein